MIRHPPRSTLFPTRRSSDLYNQDPVSRVYEEFYSADAHRTCGKRSEEHTSELQSPYDLVCRLLLEKKKTSTSPERHISAQQATTADRQRLDDTTLAAPLLPI